MTSEGKEWIPKYECVVQKFVNLSVVETSDWFLIDLIKKPDFSKGISALGCA